MTREEYVRDESWVLKGIRERCELTQVETDYLNSLIEVLEQEPCEDCIKIPEGATNGEVIEKVFPQLKGKIFSNNGFSYDIENDDGQVMVKCDGEWWNSPYRKEQE